MGWTQTTFKLENAEFSIVHNMDEVDVQNCFDNWIVRTVLKTRTNFLTYISEIEGVDFEAFHDWNELNTIHKTV